jgi:hypothetical protein
MRRRFQQAPAVALRELMALGLELSPVELAALESLDPSELHRFAQALDSRLQKAVLVVQAGPESSAVEDEEEPA